MVADNPNFCEKIQFSLPGNKYYQLSSLKEQVVTGEKYLSNIPVWIIIPSNKNSVTYTNTQMVELPIQTISTQVLHYKADMPYAHFPFQYMVAC